jgi:hypothetical protein
MATPRSLAPCLQNAAQRALPALLLFLTQCVNTYEVLGDSSAGAGGTGSAGANQGGNAAGGRASPPWTNCNDALALGTDGEPCQFAASCQTPVRDCCRTLASCNGGELDVERQCEPCPCEVDADCGLGAWCTDGRCRACTIPPICSRPLFLFAERNGCVYCVPPTECRNDSNCPSGQRCYGGQTCPPGCEQGDRTCCHGNMCAAPGCGVTDEGVDCSNVGCPDGEYCDLNFYNDCACTQTGWRCEQATQNVCRLL